MRPFARSRGLPSARISSRTDPAIAVTANATSFLLPTSNLTNLLVLNGAPLSMLAYLRASWLAWLLVASVTMVPLLWLLGRDREYLALSPQTGEGASVGMLPDL